MSKLGMELAVMVVMGILLVLLLVMVLAVMLLGYEYNCAKGQG